LHIVRKKSAAEIAMVWYVALIAVLNLGLGYALALYMGAGRGQLASSTGDSFDETEFDNEAASS